jgi:hypothetical protein
MGTKLFNFIIVRIDSNTIQVPFAAARHIDFGNRYLTHNTPTKNGVIISNTYSAHSDDLPIGISGILIDAKKETIKFSTSAKLLGDKYLEGINPNTFGQFIDLINEIDIVELDAAAVYSMGIFHKVDTTNNVDMSPIYDLNKSWKEVLDLLDIAKLNNRFSVHPYDKAHNQGITYKGDQQEKNRLIMYRKYLDLLVTSGPKGTSNRLFLQNIKDPNKFLQSTKNILRVEQNHTTFQSIRTRCKTESNFVGDVLDNGINPNPGMLDKITQPHRENQLLMVFQEYDPLTHTIQDIVELEGMKNLIRNANYCEQTLKRLIRRYTTESMFRWHWYGGKKSITPFRPLINELKLKDQNKDPQINNVVEFIRTAMLMDKIA